MCTGQVLFKKTALKISTMQTGLDLSSISSLILLLVKVPYFYIALMVYAFATFLWLYILQKVPLSVAYPFTALAMVIIPIISVFLFNEKLNVTYWFGAMLIVSGITIIAFRT